MVIGQTLATCRSCGSDVTVADIRGVGSVERSGVVIGFRCSVCDTFGRRMVSKGEARMIAGRVRGEVSDDLTEDEKLLACWIVDLSGDLTLDVFVNAWRFADKGKPPRV